MRTKLMLLFTCIFLFSTQQSFSQKLFLGPKLGLNVSSATNGGSQISSLVGINLGCFIEAKLNKTLALQGEVLFSQQGFEVEGSDETGEFTLAAKQKLSYINVPLLMKLYVGNNFNFMAGPQIGFLIDSELVGVNTSDWYNKVDFAAALGIGYDLPIGLSFDARYCPSFTNVLKKEFAGNSDNGKNYVFQLSAGWKFKIK